LGSRPAVLIAVALLLSASIAGAAERGCRRCHPVHYPERGACTECHRGEPRAVRKETAHFGFLPGRFSAFTLPGNDVVRRGEKIFENAACRRCHVSGGKGNRLTTDLDRLARDVPPTEVAASIRKPALAMPDFGFTEDQIVSLVNAIYAASRKTAIPDGRAPQVVHFTGTTPPEDVFQKKCGGCHRALTERLGVVGHGDIGPNLSGLFTVYYPATFRGNLPWNRKNLEEWLKNPRESRRTARMPPQRLTGEEFLSLLEILSVTAAGDRAVTPPVRWP